MSRFSYDYHQWLLYRIQLLGRRDIPVSTVCVDGGIMQVSFLQSVDVGKKIALYITCLTESESVTEWPVTPRDF